jgi:hypothetical protein
MSDQSLRPVLWDPVVNFLYSYGVIPEIDYRSYFVAIMIVHESYYIPITVVQTIIMMLVGFALGVIIPIWKPLTNAISDFIFYVSEKKALIWKKQFFNVVRCIAWSKTDLY